MKNRKVDCNAVHFFLCITLLNREILSWGVCL